jgi:hypothetical protein
MAAAAHRCDPKRIHNTIPGPMARQGFGYLPTRARFGDASQRPTSDQQIAHQAAANPQIRNSPELVNS